MKVAAAVSVETEGSRVSAGNASQHGERKGSFAQLFSRTLAKPQADSGLSTSSAQITRDLRPEDTADVAQETAATKPSPVADAPAHGRATPAPSLRSVSRPAGLVNGNSAAGSPASAADKSRGDARPVLPGEADAPSKGDDGQRPTATTEDSPQPAASRGRSETRPRRKDSRAKEPANASAGESPDAGANSEHPAAQADDSASTLPGEEERFPRKEQAVVRPRSTVQPAPRSEGNAVIAPIAIALPEIPDARSPQIDEATAEAKPASVAHDPERVGETGHTPSGRSLSATAYMMHANSDRAATASDSALAETAPAADATAAAIEPAAAHGKKPPVAPASPPPATAVPTTRSFATPVVTSQVAPRYAALGTDSPLHRPPSYVHSPVAGSGTDRAASLSPRAVYVPVASTPFGGSGTDNPPRLPPRAERAPVAAAATARTTASFAAGDGVRVAHAYATRPVFPPATTDSTGVPQGFPTSAAMPAATTDGVQTLYTFSTTPLGPATTTEVPRAVPALATPVTASLPVGALGRTAGPSFPRVLRTRPSAPVGTLGRTAGPSFPHLPRPRPSRLWGTACARPTPMCHWRHPARDLKAHGGRKTLRRCRQSR